MCVSLSILSILKSGLLISSCFELATLFKISSRIAQLFAVSDPTHPLPHPHVSLPRAEYPENGCKVTTNASGVRTKRCLPKLMIIGQFKAGTTAFYDTLAQARRFRLFLKLVAMREKEIKKSILPRKTLVIA